MPSLFVYRNRSDDDRGPDKMHYCSHCGGWYGVSHENSHCQRDTSAVGRFANDCACRFCREAFNLAPTGMYGFYTQAREWQPPESVLKPGPGVYVPHPFQSDGDECVVCRNPFDHVVHLPGPGWSHGGVTAKPEFDAWWEKAPSTVLPGSAPLTLEMMAVGLVAGLHYLIDEYGLVGVQNALMLIGDDLD